jgi:hypothetical protein
MPDNLAGFRQAESPLGPGEEHPAYPPPTYPQHQQRGSLSTPNEADEDNNQQCPTDKLNWSVENPGPHIQLWIFRFPVSVRSMTTSSIHSAQYLSNILPRLLSLPARSNIGSVMEIGRVRTTTTLLLHHSCRPSSPVTMSRHLR